ncbi:MULTISPECIES: pyridoxal-dependent decarboxylase [unclassified Haladaptatus]|uniref:pyridoxal phosphate-dependent decarboxylase family protein n=1 Tax=unclassified Haladaptatus TaxID=2622732 RepID=UPI0023E83E29|nr:MULTISPECIES: pyridoxal-dependent decarboxylase [unclassified Haladaptatus]
MASSNQRFTNPDLTPEEFRDLGYRTVDMIAEFYEGLDRHPVFPAKHEQDVEALFEEPLPMDGQDPTAIVEEWRTKILPNATHNTSPRYFGYVMGSGTMIGTLAEALAAAVNMNTGGWKPAPAATEVERRTISWLSELIGYDPDCGGLLTSGGTMANFIAVLTALRNVAEYDTTVKGLQTADRPGRYTLYMADHEGHSSLYRVADMLNLGREAVRLVPSKDDFTMDTAALERLLDEDIANGDVPFCVVAQVGSINVSAIDPLAKIADICASRGLWFHADGACGAVGAMLPELEARYEGLDRADSITLDPHKWLYVPYECGAVLVREGDRLRRSFDMEAPYLHGTLPTEYEGHDFYQHGPQMSRGFRALKLWMSLKHYGVEGYRELLRQNIACAHHLDAVVRSEPDFQAVQEPNLYIYSFRYVPADLRAEELLDDENTAVIDEYLDTLNQKIADAIQESGLAFFGTTSIHDRTVLRFSICSHRSTTADIDDVVAAIRAAGDELDNADRPTLAATNPDLARR